MRALGANSMTEVHCNNSITRHQRGSQRERSIRYTKLLKELDPEEARLTGATSIFDEWVPSIGSKGGIPMPTKEIVQTIRRPENHKTQ